MPKKSPSFLSSIFTSPHEDMGAVKMKDGTWGYGRIHKPGTPTVWTGVAEKVKSPTLGSSGRSSRQSLDRWFSSGPHPSTRRRGTDGHSGPQYTDDQQGDSWAQEEAFRAAQMGQTSQPEFTQGSADPRGTAGGQDTETAGLSEPAMPTEEESARAAQVKAERKAQRKAEKAAALASTNGDGPA